MGEQGVSTNKIETDFTTGQCWLNFRDLAWLNFRDFPEISPASTMADFLYPGTNIIKEWNDYCTRYNIKIDLEQFIYIRYTLKAALHKLNLPQTRLLGAQYPLKPLLIDIATLCK
jgi:hypothetical protein